MDSLQASDWILLGGALLLLVAIASSLIANRFGAPLLLVFLALGMLLGEDGPGGIHFDNHALTHLTGSLALALILFDGGLRTRASTFRGVFAPAGLLATAGVLLTVGLTGIAAHGLLGFGWVESFLAGAIVASTDAAAVFFLLHTHGLHLQKRVGATLEIESGSNDPLAVFLTTLLTGWLAAGEIGAGAMILSLSLQILAGGLLGIMGGRLIASALNRLALPGGLHPLLAIAGAVALFAATNRLGGSGFLAVYLAGLVVGNRPVRAFAHVLSVQEAVTWLAQLVMFLLLGLLVTPSHLLHVLGPALLIAAFLMFVARPLAVIACLAPFRFQRREITFIAWVGLRGAVGIFLASIPMLAGIPQAETYFNVAFVVVLASLLVQGWTLRRAAHWLGVALPRRDPPSRRIELDLPGQLEYEMVGYRVAPDSAILRGGRLPAWTRPALVVRHKQILTPEQAGPLQANDYAYFLAPPQRVVRLDWLFAEPREAREAEREVFGQFMLPGDTPLGVLASFYDLAVPPDLAKQSAGQLFNARFDGEPQIGDCIHLGPAALTVRELADDRVVTVGLKFESVGTALFGETLTPPLPASWWRGWVRKRRKSTR